MPWPQKRRLIGTKVPRLDAADKATGRAKYSFDINRPGMLHARMLRSPHAHARVKNIDTAPAEKIPGYRAVHVILKPGAEVFFAGQEIAAICADTEEHAEDCLRAIRIDYDILPHFVKETDVLETPKSMTVRGATGKPVLNLNTGGEFETTDFAKVAYQQGWEVHQGRYGVAVISHQCLESHGLVAEWNKELTDLTVWASTQAVPGTAIALAKHFGIPDTRVRCITHHMGGGYGSKFGPDIQGITCAELARKARAAVKLMLNRAEEVTVGGQRPSAYGTVKVAATKEGELKSYEVDCYGSPGVGAGATVNFQLMPYVYSNIPNLNIKRKHSIVRLNIQTGRAMRAPGHPQNCLLTDQAVDDLCARLNMDPLQFRLKNLPPNLPAAVKSAPTSFNAVRHTIYTREIEIARKLSEWDKKWHRPGADKGVVKRGIGMALHTWGGGGRGPNPTRITISRDGSVLLQSSSQDLGTAQRTVGAIVTAEILGLEPKDITIDIGDSKYGPSTGSGGSTTCPGTSPAILKAAEAARTALFAALAPKMNAQAGDLEIQPGFIVNRRNNERLAWRAACARLGENPIVANGDWPTNQQLTDDPKLNDEWRSTLTNVNVGGVQVAEVQVDTETGVVKCTKFVAVQDCGMIINKQGCESQVAGGVIMGINYALFEECIYDRATGRQVNPNMEFYKLGGIQDMPEIIVHMMDMPERGVIGIGEPPTISTAAAVGNAVFNAIGVRVPDAPFTPDRVLAALSRGK